MAASYRLERCLGKGGFGEVYLASRTGDSGLTTQVAVKLMHRDLPPEAQAVERLRDEARALAGLNHPNILSVRELTVLDGRVALVTEYVEGQDLRDTVRAGMPASAVLEACAGIGAALSEAWAKHKIIHRDVKPANIRIGRAGQVRLLDFGIANAQEMKREARTATDLMVGTHGYSAPERYFDDRSGPASDVFSLGVTTLESLCGGQRFLPGNPTELFGILVNIDRYEAHLAGWLDRVDRDEIRALLAESLAYEPEERPTARDFAKRARVLARTAAGHGLLAFCEGYAWPDPTETIEAELVGSTITEQEGVSQATTVIRAPPLAWKGNDAETVDPPSVPARTVETTWVKQERPAEPREPAAMPVAAPSPPPPTGTSTSGLAWGLGLGVFGALALVVVVATASIGWWSLGSSEPEPVASVPEPMAALRVPAEPPPVEASEPTPRPDPSPRVAPVPRVAPAPRAAPVVEPVPAAVEPTPRPVEPEPEAEPPVEPVSEPAVVDAVEAAEEPRPMGTVTLVSPVIELRGGGSVFSTGRVPVGRYVIFADFGKGPVNAGSVEVKEGGSHTVKCSTLLESCK
ncbi:MAG: protein kinase [Proteobacteria bacterium]|nr:protein kinase [Pseudomonadota bacterium]